MTSKDELQITKDRLETELLKDPRYAGLILNRKNEKGREEIDKMRQEVLVNTAKVISMAADRLGSVESRGHENTSTIIGGFTRELAKVEKALKAIETKEDTKAYLELKELRKELKKLADRDIPAPVVNIKAPIVTTPEPTIIDETKIIQETKYQEKLVALVDKLIEIQKDQSKKISKIESTGKIRNDKASEAIPVILTDKRGKKFQDLGDIQSFIAAGGGGSGVAGDVADLDSTNGTVDKHNVVAIGIPGASGHVVAGTTTDPLNIAIGDGTTRATVRELGVNDALNVSVTDANGNQITSFGGGVQYAEDTPSVDGESLTLSGFVRRDAPFPTTSADGDRTNGATDSLNRLWVNASGVPVPVTDNAGSITVDGAVSVLGTVPVDSELPAATTLTDATANPTTPLVGVATEIFNGTTWDRARGDTTNGLDVDVTRLPPLVAGSAKIGVVDLDSDATIASAVPTVAQFVAGTDGTNSRALKTDTGGELQIDVLTMPSVVQATAANLNMTEASAVAIKNAVEALDNAADTVNNILAVMMKPVATTTNSLTWDDSAALEASSVSKSSAGNVYQIFGFSNTTTVRYFHVYNSATVPANGAVPLISIVLNGRVSFSLDVSDYGKQFTTGISWANSTTAATKTLGGADLWVNVGYK